MGAVRRPSAASIVSLATVGGVVAFVVWQLDPALLVSNTTTAGGDTGAHVALPAFLRHHLLTHGRITGWSPQWYDGYPLYTFYFPLPDLAVALASFVIPYDIAFKLVTVAGVVSLPVAAWAMGRLLGLRRPAPECLAVAMLPFLFDRTFTIDGGNLASTLAGEYAFSISLSLGLVFLGVVARGLRTGRHRALAAALLALTALCHMIPTLFVAAGAVVLTASAPGPLRQRLRWALPVGVVALAITGFWTVPFVLRQAYTTNMGWTKVTTYVATLFPSAQIWVVALAAVGALAALARRQRAGIFLAVMAGLSALAFVASPQGKLYNARLLPFWVLCLYLLAGLGAAELGRLAARAWRLARTRSAGAELVGPPGALLTPLAALVAGGIFVAAPLVSLPSWLQASVPRSFLPSWVQWNYSGYQGKASWPEYHGLVGTMAKVGRRHGCGRAMWEYQPQLDRMGTPMALMLLPYWTGGCIDSMEGLLFESSATTPYHFVNQSELSLDPSRAMQGLPYGSLDVAAGVRHLQLLGVRYYMAISPSAEAQAAADPALSLVATSGPWPVTYNGQVEQRTWDVYQIRDSAEVTALRADPAVLKGGAPGAKGWLHASLAWYEDPARFGVPLAAGGPPSWPRVVSSASPAPRRAVAPTTVDHVVTSDGRISFDVGRTGSPVLVKTSYFPNWQASGARGPFRVTPNLMVVVPTSHHVTLAYGTTAVDAAGWAVTLAGLAGLVWLAVVGRLPMGASGRRRRWRAKGAPPPKARHAHSRGLASRDEEMPALSGPSPPGPPGW